MPTKRHNVASLQALQDPQQLESGSSFTPFPVDQINKRLSSPGIAGSYSRLTITSAQSSAAPSPASASYRQRSIAYKNTNEVSNSSDDQYQRLASHIWGGQISHDSYMNMLDRVRQQFRKPQMHGHDPLIFPPQIPSASRPGDPEIPKFSRGIRLLRGGLLQYTNAIATSRRQSEDQRSRSDTAVSLPPLEATTASLAIYELGSLDQKEERLLELETLERRRLENTEKWDRNVVNEMMVVHYVTYVLKPEMEEIQAKERFMRGMIRYDEEKEFYYLYNESPLAQIISTETRALREKEAKLARLRQLDNEYVEKKQPTSTRTNNNFIAGKPFGGRGNALNGNVKEVETSRLPNQVNDARTILQKYVRQKHSDEIDDSMGIPRSNGNAIYTPNTGRRVSSLPLPPISALPRRKTLGVADYINLLDEDDQYRALIEIAERDERRDINRLMRDDWQAVMDWQRKHMHLQRLVYWRNEREENLKKELACMSCTAGLNWSEEDIKLLQAIADDEQSEREAVEASEVRSFEQIAAASKFQRDFFDQQNIYKQALKSKQGIEVEYCSGLIDICEQQEASLRTINESNREAFICTVQEKGEILKMLYNISIKPKSFRAVLTIQRAYYKYKRGLMGYKLSHKKIAQEVHAKRTAEKLKQGLGAFDEYRKQLQAEIDEIDGAALAQFLKGVEKLQSVEFNDRLIMNSHEAMGWSNLKRAFVRSLREDVIGGKIREMFEEELKERTETEVKEQLGFSSIVTFSRQLSRLITQKERTVALETEERHTAAQDEEDEWKELMGNEYDRREEIRIEAEEEAARLEQDRAVYSLKLEADHEARAQSLLTEHFLFINKQQQRGVTKEAFELVFYEQLFEKATSDLIQEWADWAVSGHSVYGWVDCISHQRLIHLREVELHEENEKLTRRAMEKEEDNAFHAIRDNYVQMLEETKEQLDDEQRAVRLLCQTWRKYKQGDLGRSATRKFLHEAFRPKREKMEIAKRNAANLDHINGIRGLLANEEEKQRKEFIANIALQLEVLVNKTEPRARWDIKDQEDMIFTITRNNFCSAGIRAFDPRNKMALLWQQESYERVMIKKEWKRAFEVEFAQKKATIREDVMVRPIQRAWRAYVKRRDLKIVHDAQQDVLSKAELSDRYYIMERESVIYRDLYHELLRAEWGASLMFEISPAYIIDQQKAAFETLVQEEWCARIDLLWEMRYDLCDGCLSTEEYRERQELVKGTYMPGHQQAEFFSEETLIRDLLYQERRYFLLRMLCKQERAHRETITAEAQQGTAECWLEMEEELARETIVDDYCQFWRESIYEPLAVLLANKLEEEEEMQRFWTDFLAQEHQARAEVIDEEIIGRQRQVMLMEKMLRGLMHTNEQFERQGSVVLFWTEEKERMELMMEWASGLHYGPSSFAPNLVYQRMPVYIRCIEEAEVLVREYLENSERAAADFIQTNIDYLQEEYAARMGLKVEEKVVREQRVLLLEEQQERSEIISDWARGVRYVPSSFAPEIVNQRINVFLGAVEQTESISRDYISLSEDIAFRSIRREKMYLDYEENERKALLHLEEVELLVAGIELEEETARNQIIHDFQSGLFYAPSSFAPNMVNTEIPLYIRCITDAEELVRRKIDDEEADLRRFYKKEKWEKEEQIVAMDTFNRVLEEQREAVEAKEHAGRREIWRDAFEFIRQEGDDEPENNKGTDTQIDMEKNKKEPEEVEDGEDMPPAPLPPVIIQNERYVTFVEGIEALEKLSRTHIWGKYIYNLTKICLKYFPDKPIPQFEDAPDFDDEFEDSSEDDEEDEDENGCGNRKDTLMMLRKSPESDPAFYFIREESEAGGVKTE